MYKQIKGSDIEFDENLKLELDCNKSAELEVIKELKDKSLPKIKRLYINKIENGGEHIKEFLQNAVPQDLKLFFTQNRGTIINDSSTIGSIIAALSKTKKEIFLCLMDLNSKYQV